MIYYWSSIYRDHNFRRV